jgi:hypothetical protein
MRFLARLREFEPALRERGIAHAALFGSAARGDNGPESDIDIMVEFAPEARVTRRRSRLCIRRPLRRRLLCGLTERSRHESNQQIPCLRPPALGSAADRICVSRVARNSLCA